MKLLTNCIDNSLGSTIEPSVTVVIADVEDYFANNILKINLGRGFQPPYYDGNTHFNHSFLRNV